MRFFPRLKVGLLLFAVACAALVAGCGSSSTEGTANSQDTKNAYTTPPKSGCGSYTASLKDPDGVLDELGPEQQAGLAGFTAGNDFRRSNWAGFKADKPTGWTVGVVFGPTTNDLQVKQYNGIKNELADDPRVSKVYAATPASSLDVPRQLQDMNTMINRDVDVIVLQGLIPESFTGIVDRAAAKGIPTVTTLGNVPSANAINTGFNDYTGLGSAASSMLRLNKGKGNYLFVHGIPGTGPDLTAIRVWKELLKSCPGAKTAGDVYGNYVNAEAKSETLKFLGTHPEKVDGVVTTGAMAPGVLQAFEQSGRSVPTVVDSSGSKGSLGYWRNNPGKYNGTSYAVGDGTGQGQAVANVALRTLAGEGPIGNAIFKDPAQVNPDNLDQWSDPSWTLTTPGGAPGPPGPFFEPAFLDGFFENPGK
ncbi:MAG TPA: substrate-binding domain-containing protein [Vicinamibacterales bacterium]|nr:substrate-binding domain-containing protein [Vicinamibacterales bacterium]